ncbi:hypothetical protein LPB03_01585 [Polaribacter vadi]|uniref:Uncharacterized protein n=1 Tax=Polaribacter vadi TaxID=1774273 RepID=A0A1B8U0S8_9FLAO|nr:hypothetical protein [Polaribacter vadi]AOW16228.1 hypothetical protein LPB03_01585 [Polaribacter vadi]OBY65446.1 hypothetical protein LPB3_03525 [Polaribacter vadi]
MIKKIFGAFFILISIFLGLGFLMQIPTIIGTFSNNFTGYSFGYIFGSLLILGIAILLFKLGLKWTRKNPNPTDNINNIGINK